MTITMRKSVNATTTRTANPRVITVDLARWPLKDVINDTKTRAWCGPTAIASITGKPISVVRNAFRFVRFGDRWLNFPRSTAIVGVTMWEVQAVLKTFGLTGHWETLTRQPTLASWLEDRVGLCRIHPTIVHVTGHFVAISAWEFCDTFSRGYVVDAEEAPGRRKRVKDVFVITGFTAPASAIPSKQRSAEQLTCAKSCRTGQTIDGILAKSR